MANFLNFAAYQLPHARNKINNNVSEEHLRSMKLSIKISMKKIQLLLFEKNEFEYWKKSLQIAVIGNQPL